MTPCDPMAECSVAGDSDIPVAETCNHSSQVGLCFMFGFIKATIFGAHCQLTISALPSVLAHHVIFAYVKRLVSVSELMNDQLTIHVAIEIRV